MLRVAAEGFKKSKSLFQIQEFKDTTIEKIKYDEILREKNKLEYLLKESRKKIESLKFHAKSVNDKSKISYNREGEAEDFKKENAYLLSENTRLLGLLEEAKTNNSACDSFSKVKELMEENEELTKLVRGLHKKLKVNRY
jgi:hypothetical protein